MNYTLLSSPLQGFTDFRFRNAFNTIFGGIDTFYAPYIRLNGNFVIKSAYERDLLPENNVGLEVIPQVITNDADEFLFVSKNVQQLGYKELNWNTKTVKKFCMFFQFWKNIPLKTSPSTHVLENNSIKVAYI